MQQRQGEQGAGQDETLTQPYHCLEAGVSDRQPHVEAIEDRQAQHLQQNLIYA